jgi:hypothetical protein
MCIRVYVDMYVLRMQHTTEISRATVSFPCMYVRTYIYTTGEPQRLRLAHVRVQGLNACAISTVGRTPTSMLRRPPGVGVDCAHATPTIQKETLGAATP